VRQRSGAALDDQAEGLRGSRLLEPRHRAAIGDKHVDFFSTSSAGREPSSRGNAFCY
jgi:hypothetical protein